MKIFDAIVIGSGQAGIPLAKKLAQNGRKTAIIEKDFIGGTCINTGCTPTKAMVASAKAAYDFSVSKKLGIKLKGFEVDITAVIKRKNEIVKEFREGAAKGIKGTRNLTLFFGEASFVDKNKILIKNKNADEVISGEKIFINAGGRPAIPEIEGLKKINYLTSTTIMEVTEIPEHLLIIGGSYIGLEFGQMFRRFGSKITILENNKKFLSKEDDDISKEIMKFLEEEKIKILCDTHARKIEKRENKIKVTVTNGDHKQKISCTHLLLAAGRTPNSDTLNLKAAGINTDERGHIITNEKLETNIEDIYALGDIKGGPEFTHISYNDYIVIADNLLNNANRTITDRMVPYCMFTDPQLGHIGITENEAYKKGLNIKVAVLPMSRVARAIETGDTRGMMKAIVDAGSGMILGASILGEQGGEIMSILQTAMTGKIHYKQIKEMIFAHPLYAESLNNLFMELDK